MKQSVDQKMYDFFHGTKCKKKIKQIAENAKYYLAKFVTVLCSVCLYKHYKKLFEKFF